MAKITLLIATPSPLEGERLTNLLKTSAEIDVLGICGNLSETFTRAEAAEPDIVVVAEVFCRLKEWEGMKSLFKVLGTAWIVAAEPSILGTGQDGLQIEPRLPIAEVMTRIRTQIASFRHGQQKRTVVAQATAPVHYEHLVLIGASTGGVDALLAVLSSFPQDCPPTAIVQHTGKGFSESLVRLLDRRCKPQVVAARDATALIPGRICVAAGLSEHLTIKAGAPNRCAVRSGPAVSGHVPSVDVLFQSAVPIADKVIGVILTGMGQDGAQGLLALRRAGAQTLGQDAASSVVYGMPRAAWSLGAVQRQLPIMQIGEEIMRLCSAVTGGLAETRMAGR